MMSKIFTPFYQPFTGTRRVYISGPMSGHKNNNFDAFDDAAKTLRRRGFSVCSPSDTDRWLGELSHAEYLRFDFARVLEADLLIALEGWEQSVGALAEIFVALRIGTEVYEWKGERLRWQIHLSEVEEAIGALNAKE